MRLLFVAVAGLAAACSSDHRAAAAGGPLVANDFEGLAGWVGDSPSLTQEKAHSGRYAIKTDQGVEYSLGYRNVLLQVSDARLSKLRLTAYVWADKVATPAVLMAQVNRSPQDGTAVFTHTIEVAKAVQAPGEWTKISQVFTLPASVAGNNELRLYLWQPGAPGPVYLDDLSLDVEP